MTTYAHDPLASAIVATWPTGDGAVAHRVARVPRAWDPALARRTAGALTTLSARLWLAYSDQEVPEIVPDGLAAAVREPHQPVGDLLVVADDDRVEAAHQVGRIVSGAPGRAFRETIAGDVLAEGDAVVAADGGDLTGRAQQAVEHCRSDASPAQLVAADALLRQDPLGPPGLCTSVEPFAAGVAALRWLRAATARTAGLVGHSAADVVALAEAIGHEELAVARAALDMLPSGRSEAQVVRELLQEAVLAGRGYFVVCPERPPEADDPGEHRHRAAVTVLDPREPGRSLVGGLLRGIQGCFHVYLDEVTTRDRPGVDPRRTGPEWAAGLRTAFSHDLRTALRSPQ